MAGTSGLPLAGVEAIVEGLSAFKRDVRKMNSLLDSIRPRSTLLQNAFSGALDMVGNFGREVLNVAEYALGQILADSIQWVIGKLGELAQATIEAGGEFQTLELRLQGMNVDALVKSGMNYNAATKEAIELTKEQLEWLQKLASATPYDNTDISNVYTLARAYGFADDSAKELTDSVVNFASGMGLEKEVLERVIMNLGQMVQRGKITSTEMRDLARGAFLPLDDILQRIADHMNETGESLSNSAEDTEEARQKLSHYNNQMEVLLQRQSEFTDKTKESTKISLTNQIEELQAKIDDTTSSLGALQEVSGKVTVADVMKEISKPGGGLPAQLFIDAFNEMVSGEARFSGAAERMAKTFGAASDNAKDMVKSIGGLNVVKPILDKIGARISEFVESFTGDPGRWNRLTKAASRLGEALSSVVEGVLGLLPGTEGLAEKVILTINGIAKWIEEHRSDIIDFFIRLGQTIKEEIIPWIENKFLPAIREFGKWVEDNKGTIMKFFSTVGDIISDLFAKITNIPEGEEGGGILDTITKFMQFVIDNKDGISKWLEILWSVFIVWQVLATIWNIALTIVIALGGFIIALVGAFVGLQGVLTFVIPLIGALLAPLAALLAPLAVIGLLVAALVASWKIMGTFFRIGTRAWAENLEELKLALQRLKENFLDTIEKIKEAFLKGDWIGIGKAILEGIINGMFIWSEMLYNMVRNVATIAGEEFKKTWNAGLFGSVPAATSSTGSVGHNGNSYSTNNEYNLNINSGANSEPVVQDFKMLQAIQGY